MIESEEEEKLVRPMYTEATKYRARLAEVFLALITVICVFVAVISKTDGLTGFFIIAALIFGALTGVAYVVREIVMQKEHFDPRKHTFTGGSGGGEG